jgi:predicted permease
MSWLRYLRRGKWDEERARELEAHLTIEAEENVARGMSREEARYAAQRKLGNQTLIREEIYKMNSLHFFETLWQDARYGARMLRRNPGFTAVAVLTLALGIGANTAIFSVVYAVLLKPLPYANASQLMTVFEVSQEDAKIVTGWSYLNFEELREQNNVFSEMAGTQQHQLTLTGRGEPSVVDTSVVTPEFFLVFGEKPLAGRVFRSEDGKRGSAPVAVLSENLWRETFGADPKIIGSSIDLDKRSFTVIGIMPAAFRFPILTQSEQVWIPLAQDPLFGGWMERRGGHWLRVTARLKPGVSMKQAETEVNGVTARLAKEFPGENGGWVAGMMPLQSMLVENVQSTLLVLLGAVGLVLLIACANIANLLLTRATSRSKEIAVRTALGAGRTRVIRQLLSESAVLGLLGGIAGIALAYWGVRALSSLIPDGMPRANEIHVDNFVLGFALALSALASMAFGLAPALFAANGNVQMNLRDGGRSGEGGNRRRARNFLATGEIALAMVLLMAAGLLLRSFAKLTAMSPGFDATHLVKADISLPRFQYSTPQQWASFSSDLLTGIQAEPGMKDSAVAVPMPLADGFVNLAFSIVGAPPLSPGASRTANYVSVSPEYLRVMGIRLLAGRFFSSEDAMSTQSVSVVSQTMARTYFPNEDPIGKRITFGFPPNPETEHEIVGVVGDVRDIALGQNPGPMMYVPYAQAPFWGANLVVKSTLGTAGVAAAIRRQVAKIDKDLPVTDVAQMPDIIDDSLAQQKFSTFLLGLFAAMALVLAATGIFGVISYSVSRRTHEIGIRVALGASRQAILRMVLRETLILAIGGLTVGVPCALAASRLLGHMLFGISADDPATLAIVALSLATVAALAGYVPARRAMRVDPMVALRYE